MNAGKVKPFYDWLKPWPASATLGNMAYSISSACAYVLEKLGQAERAGDAAGMEAASKEFRAIATHVDAYRRMKVREMRKKEGVSNESSVQR